MAWPRSASRPRARPTRSRSRWPTGWSATVRARARSRSRAAGPGCAASARATSAVVGAGPEVRVDGSAGARRPGAAARARARWSRCGACGAAAAPIWRWPAGSLGPDWHSGAARATNSAGLGAGPLEPGASCSRRTVGAAARRPSRRRAPPPSSDADGPVELRVVPGPHAEWFRPDALARLGPAVFRGDGRRATGSGSGCAPTPGDADAACASGGRASSTPRAWSPARCRCRRTVSPVVLLPDHATLGGYPVVAVVASADHGLLGQCATGHARCASSPIGADEADERPAVAAPGAGPAPSSVTTRSPRLTVDRDARGRIARQTSSLTAVPTPMTTTTTRRAGAGRARARRAPT